MLFNIPSAFRTFEMLILSWTSYAPLTKATEPGEFDAVLQKTLQDIKFHCETLLSMLFFMGTTMQNSPLISWTLASLLYSLIAYTALEAMSGDSLHLHLDAIPLGRPLLAMLAKLPALTVLATLCALAVTSWESVFTGAVLVAAAGVLVLVLALRMRVHSYIAEVLEAAAQYVFAYIVRCRHLAVGGIRVGVPRPSCNDRPDVRSPPRDTLAPTLGTDHRDEDAVFDFV